MSRATLVTPLLLAALGLPWLAGCGQEDAGPSGPQTGSLAVLSSLPGAAIYLDGTATGRTTPDTLLEVSAGTHGVVVSLGGYVCVPDSHLVAADSAAVTVTAGATAAASFTMTAYAYDRVVVVEHFSNWNCTPCADADPKLDSLMVEQGPAPGAGRAVRIGYHDNIASLNDPFYLANPEDAEERTDYYNVLDMPSIWLCGRRHNPPIGWANPLAYTVLRDSVVARAATGAPLAITVTDGTGGGTFSVHAEITAQAGFRPRNCRIRIVVVELENTLAEPAPNGLTEFGYVMRDMVPDAAGEALVMTPGETLIVDRETTIGPTWGDDLGAVVFVQREDATREVLQAGSSF